MFSIPGIERVCNLTNVRLPRNFLRGHGSQTNTHYGIVEYEDRSLLYEESAFVDLFLFITISLFLLTKRYIYSK